MIHIRSVSIGVQCSRRASLNDNYHGNRDFKNGTSGMRLHLSAFLSDAHRLWPIFTFGLKTGTANVFRVR